VLFFRGASPGEENQPSANINKGLCQQAGVNRQKTVNWIKADEGLYVGEFESPRKAITGSSKITVIRIDLRIYSFELLH
jgi:hypothetical protein